jgi:hypothetical protein
MSYFVPETLSDITFKIYGPHTNNSPGELLMEMTKNNLTVETWNEITLPEPILIDKSEYWFVVEFYHALGAHPISVDADNDSQLVPQCNWIRFNGGGSWTEWSDWGNFMIKGTAQGGTVPACWLSLSGDTYGSIPKGATKTFNAKFNAAGLEKDKTYNATIYVATSDEENPLFTIPCTLFVGDSYTVSFIVNDCKTEDPIQGAKIVFNGETITGYVINNVLPGKYS